jgi:hypothetical protein
MYGFARPSHSIADMQAVSPTAHFFKHVNQGPGSVSTLFVSWETSVVLEIFAVLIYQRVDHRSRGVLDLVGIGSNLHLPDFNGITSNCRFLSLLLSYPCV